LPLYILFRQSSGGGLTFLFPALKFTALQEAADAPSSLVLIHCRVSQSYRILSREAPRFLNLHCKVDRSLGAVLSQNHRMVGVGRDLGGSSSPTLPPKQGHLQQAAGDFVQAGLEYLQRRRLHHLPGQPVPVLRYCSIFCPKFCNFYLFMLQYKE